MSDLADLLATYEHDRPFCGRMTKAGIPCQRQSSVLFNGCPRHNALVEIARALPSIMEPFKSAMSTIAESITTPAERLRRMQERRRIRTWYVEFEPTEQPPALEAPPR